MTAQIDLHGAEVLHLPDQTAPITVGPSSVVGLVGAAPRAQRETRARLAIGRGNAALTFTAAGLVAAQAASLVANGTVESGAVTITADETGPDGNGISVALVVVGAATANELVAVDGNAITVTLRSAGSSDLSTSTAATVAAAINGDAAAGALVTAVAGGGGTGRVAAADRAFLAGGANGRDTRGAAGNAVTLEIVRPNQASQALTVTVDGTAITVSLATDATGAVTTTAAELVTAWAAALNAAARALLAIAATGASTGADAVSPLARTPLAGGLDEPFPLNTPVVISTPAAAARLGTEGSLPDAIADVWRTAGAGGATIVVVRTADDEAGNVIGSRDDPGSGIYALLRAEAAETAQLKPRLIAAPALQTTAAALALEAVADELRAIPVVTLEGATYSAAVAAKASLAHSYPVWPRFRVFDAGDGRTVERSASALTVGHMVRVDAEESFAASPSNRRLQDVAGTAIAVDWQIDDRNSTANLLSRAFIATAIRRRGGLHLWGNRLADGELVTHRRVRHLIGDALLDFIADYIDRNVDVPFVEHVLDRMSSYLRSQTLARIITGGRAWFDAAYNTPDTLAANQVTFSFDLGLHAVAEDLTFRQSVSGIYNAGIIAQLTGAEA